jgi:uncharacterized protein (TIGR02246 family)
MVKRIVYCTVLLFCAATAMAADAPAADDRKAILAVDEKYVKDFNAGNIDEAMKSFTEDAVYLTDEGETLNGLPAIKQYFQGQFDEMRGAQLRLKVYAIDFAADKQSATERGVSVVTFEGTEEPSSYTADFKLQGGQWRVARVKESPESASAEHLKPLEWMIGDWSDVSEDSNIRTKSEWALDRAFITRRFDVSGDGRRGLKGIEYIGWDPAKKEIHSWYFDSEGGYGGGRWRFDAQNKSWVEDSVGITPKGEVASATHIFKPKDKNSFTFRSINRRFGDEAQDDVPEITIQRNSEQQQVSAAREPL